MTNSQSHADGSLGDDELRWLEVRADGGFGIIATCASHVTRDHAFALGADAIALGRPAIVNPDWPL